MLILYLFLPTMSNLMHLWCIFISFLDLIGTKELVLISLHIRVYASSWNCLGAHWYYRCNKILVINHNKTTQTLMQYEVLTWGISERVRGNSNHEIFH